MGKPQPASGQWWRFGAEEGHVERLLPGGAGGLGIAVLNIPPAHVNTMLRFDAWTHLPDGPTQKALPPPCSCRELPGGAILSDGCLLHDADAVALADFVTDYEPRALRVGARPAPEPRRHAPILTLPFDLTPKDTRS